MRKIVNLFMLVALFAFSGKSVADTANTIDWSGYASELSTILSTSSTNNFVYLYNVEHKLFLTSGAHWGTQGVLANVGMRLKIEKNGSYYKISTRLANNSFGGSYLGKAKHNGGEVGYGIYMDRTESESSWSITETATGSKCYYLYDNTNSGYISFGNNDVLQESSSQTDALTWYIVTDEDLIEVLQKSAQDYLEVTQLMRDTRFELNNTDSTYWNWSNNTDYKDSYICNYSVVSIGAYQCVRIKGVQTFSQQIESTLPVGFYRLSCQGFYNGSNNKAYLFVTKTKSDGSTVTEKVKILDVASTETLNSNTTNTEVDGVRPRAIEAGEIFASKNMYDDGENDKIYFNSVYIKIEDGDTNITIGVENGDEDGEVYVDNFRLFYLRGNPAIYLSANASEASAVEGTDIIDNNAYDANTATVAYLRRSFTLNAWNALCLPFDVPAGALKTAFGTDVALCELVGVNPQKDTQIMFKAVDLDDTSNPGKLEAHHCYVIKPTKAPSCATYNDMISFYSKDKSGEAKYRENVRGPIYEIVGVRQDAYDLVENKAAKAYSGITSDNKLQYSCYYVKTTAPAGSYVQENGNMYYLTSSQTLYGTTWLITDLTESSGAKGNIMSFSIEDSDHDTSEISGLVVSAKRDTNTRIYNLSGMAVGTAAQMDNLPKGIYIMNGKKFVVR